MPVLMGIGLQEGVSGLGRRTGLHWLNYKSPFVLVKKCQRLDQVFTYSALAPELSA
jgi:hypothetical protein